MREPKCVTLELKFGILQDDWFHYVQPGTRHKCHKKRKGKKNDATFVNLRAPAAAFTARHSAWMFFNTSIGVQMLRSATNP